MERGVTSIGYVVEYVALLQSQGHDDGEHAFDEAASIRRVGAKTDLPPDYGVPQELLGVVIRWLHAFVIDEGEQRVSELVDLFADARDFGANVSATQRR